MSEGDHTNDATEHTTTGEENLANQGSENVEGGEGLKAGAGAEGGDVHGDEASDEVKINEDGQKRAFGEQEEGEEDGEEYDDEEEYDDDEGKPTNLLRRNFPPPSTWALRGPSFPPRPLSFCRFSLPAPRLTASFSYSYSFPLHLSTFI
jgi:hypothetical protein